jgi:hypothetical protein
MSGYYAVTGTKHSIRMIGKSSSPTKKAAVSRAQKYAEKNPDKAVMVVTIKRVKIVRKPPKK